MQPLCQQQLEREAHAEAGDFRAHVRQSAAARGRRQIDVHPGILVADEALEKTRREDVIALAVDTALHDVGDGTICIYDIKTGISGLGSRQNGYTSWRFDPDGVGSAPKLIS